MRAFHLFLISAAALLASGCSIQQTVTPAELSSDLSPEICLIPAAGLRAGFNTTYDGLLKDKGFHTRQLPPGTDPATCPLSTTYIGTWNWDMAIYMSHADIRVFQRGTQVGQAEYDSRHGGGRVIDKFIDADKKIKELTDQLFPKGAAGLAGIQSKIAERPVTQQTAVSGATQAAVTAPRTSVTSEGPMTKEAYRKAQLDLLTRQGLPYDQYQQRYNEIMAN